MIVQCPRCSTQYRVPDSRITDPHPVFKCTRCSLVFSGDERGPRPAAKERDPADERNLTLPFERGAEPDDAAADQRSSRERPGTPTRAGSESARPSAGTARTASSLHDEPTRAGPDLQPDRPERRGEHVLDDPEAFDDHVHDELDEPDELEAPPPRPTERPRAAPARTAGAAREAPPRPGADEPTRAAPARLRASAEPPSTWTTEDRPAKAAVREPNPRATARSMPGRGRERDLTLDDDFTTDPDDESDEAEDSPVLMASPGKRARGAINPRRRAPEPRRGRSPLRPLGIAVAMVTAGYLVLAVTLKTHPEIAFEGLAEVPLLGRLLGDDHLLTWRLQLTDIEGSYDHIKGDRPAYVVTGRAVNTTNRNVQLIEVEGRLLVNGVEKRHEVVNAVNQSRKTIRDLSPSEVEMLLRLEPNKRFVIRPGESASFLLVFPDPPREATEVACRVVGARGV